MMSSLRWVQDMMTSDDKVGGWLKKGQNHDDVILECSLIDLHFESYIYKKGLVFQINRGFVMQIENPIHFCRIPTDFCEEL